MSTPATVQFILDSGGNINAPAKFGLTALHFAVSRGNLEMVQFLVTKGADVNAVEGFTEQTPLSDAYNLQRRDIAEYLIAHGAKASNNQ